MRTLEEDASCDQDNTTEHAAHWCSVLVVALVATAHRSRAGGSTVGAFRRGARLESLRFERADKRHPYGEPPGAGQPPPVSQLHLAMVQGAVYDAVNAIVGGYQPYLPDLPTASPSASQEAAVATAAHHVLVGLGIEDVPPLPQVVRDRLDAPLCRRARRHPRRRCRDRGRGSRGSRRSGHARRAN